jgi:transcription elongation factor Elf1
MYIHVIRTHKKKTFAADYACLLCRSQAVSMKTHIFQVLTNVAVLHSKICLLNTKYVTYFTASK